MNFLVRKIYTTLNFDLRNFQIEKTNKLDENFFWCKSEVSISIRSRAIQHEKMLQLQNQICAKVTNGFLIFH